MVSAGRGEVAQLPRAGDSKKTVRIPNDLTRHQIQSHSVGFEILPDIFLHMKNVFCSSTLVNSAPSGMYVRATMYLITSIEKSSANTHCMK